MKKQKKELFSFLNIKKLTVWDIKFIKWSVFFITLFLVRVWPAFRNLVLSIHWAWFLIIGLAFAIKPCIKVFSK
jgi:uncharacterized membrane protein YqjE